MSLCSGRVDRGQREVPLDVGAPVPDGALQLQVRETTVVSAVALEGLDGHAKHPRDLGGGEVWPD